MDNKRAVQLLQEAGVYMPSVVPGLGRGGFFVFSATKALGHGETVEAAFLAAKAAGEVPDHPPLPAFRYEGKNVLRNGEAVAVCNSRTLAHRIANALNHYNANERGF